MEYIPNGNDIACTYTLLYSVIASDESANHGRPALRNRQPDTRALERKGAASSMQNANRWAQRHKATSRNYFRCMLLSES
jgi:hypothetical protein